MTRTFAATILAATMAFAPAAQADRLIYRPPSAGQNQNQTAQILGGLAALGVLGYAFKELRDDDDDDDRDRHRARRDRHDGRDGRYGWSDRRRGGDWRRADLLPARCLQRVDSRRGSYRLFGARCLDRSGVALRRLPGECRKDVRVRGGWRAAYSEPCLRQRGWRAARHR